MQVCRSIGERRLLQLAVGVLAVVPVLSGLLGILLGLDAFGSNTRLSHGGDSHVRYLSGLLLAIGIGFWSTIPRIESHGPRFRLLSCLVLTGGAARFLGLIFLGEPTIGAVGALLMEIVVTPGLALWRERLERRMELPQEPQMTSSVLSLVSP